MCAARLEAQTSAHVRNTATGFRCEACSGSNPNSGADGGRLGNSGEVSKCARTLSAGSWPARIEKARTAFEEFSAIAEGHPGTQLYAASGSLRQHMLEIRLLTLNVKLVSQGGRRRPFRFLSPFVLRGKAITPCMTLCESGTHLSRARVYRPLDR